MNYFFLTFILTLSFSCCYCEEMTCDKLTLHDGRVLVGKYDADNGMIELISETSGKPIAKFAIKSADVKGKESITLNINKVDPNNKIGLDGRWIASYPTALKLAKESNRPIMALFTGSDWCPSCIKLEKEVLSQNEFQAWAKDHFVLLKIDFPNAGYAVNLKKANSDIAAKFNVTGYPTILFIDAQEKPHSWKWGYKAGGVENWIQAVNQTLKLISKETKP